MTLNYMKEDAVTQLRENMLNNLSHYKSGQDWVGSYLTELSGIENWFLESRIHYQTVKLKVDTSNSRESSKSDAENAKLIYNSLKMLTPTQAIDPRIWTYLSHVVYPEYMAERWLNTKKEITQGTLERYFANSSREIIRNGIARLWWYGYLTYDETRNDPYELTDFMLSNQNIAQGLLERNLGNNKRWLINMLDIIQKHKTEYPRITHSDNIKALIKHLNFSGGVTLLDSLNRSDTEIFFLDWVRKNNIEQEVTVLI